MRRTSRERVREQLVERATRQWEQHAHAVRLGSPALTFDVAGRSENGDRAVRKPNRAQRVIRTAVKGFASVLGMVLVVVCLILSVDVPAGDSDFPDPPARKRIRVRGPGEDDAASGFGDAVRKARGTTWLVWSDSRLAVVDVDDDRRFAFRWQSEPGQLPTFRAWRPTATRAWPDGSSAVVRTGRWEKHRLRKLRSIT